MSLVWSRCRINRELLEGNDALLSKVKSLAHQPAHQRRSTVLNTIRACTGVALPEFVDPDAEDEDLDEGGGGGGGPGGGGSGGSDVFQFGDGGH
jgi:hypothetical protein